MSNEELIELRRQLINGDNALLKDYYLQHKKDIVNFLLIKKYCNKESAEGHFADAIIVLRNNVVSKKIETLTNLKSYLISICVNLSRNENYKKKRKEDQVRLLLHEKNYNINDKWDVKSERIEICKKALLTLSAKCQKILFGFYVHNLTMKDIAVELGLSSSDVAKTLKSRCYKSWMAEVKNRL